MVKNVVEGMHDDLPACSLGPFLLITFGLAWGILGLYIFCPDSMTRIFGALTGRHPLFFLAVYAPAIAAFLVIGARSGTKGLRRFLSRILMWRCSVAWYVFLALGVPCLFYCGLALKGNFSANLASFSSFPSLMTAVALTIVKGPVEEFGWRGLALPVLQRRLAPVWAGMVLGVIWGFWHLPAFLLSGTQQSAWAFTPFFIGSVAISLIATGMFNASRGSILLQALFHFQLINPLWPDAQPHDTLFFVVAAGIVVWVQRQSMFDRHYAVTTVIPRRDMIPFTR